jgi:hypothetical protein
MRPSIRNAVRPDCRRAAKAVGEGLIDAARREGCRGRAVLEGPPGLRLSKTLLSLLRLLESELWLHKLIVDLDKASEILVRNSNLSSVDVE